MATTYSASATLTEGMSFLARTSSGIELESEPDVGGQGRGPRPKELVLMALAGCTSMDVISILRKMRQDVTAYAVRVRGDERGPDFPKVFTTVTA
jgi:putative redox protein